MYLNIPIYILCLLTSTLALHCQLSWLRNVFLSSSWAVAFFRIDKIHSPNHHPQLEELSVSLMSSSATFTLSILTARKILSVFMRPSLWKEKTRRHGTEVWEFHFYFFTKKLLKITVIVIFSKFIAKYVEKRIVYHLIEMNIW